jgi:hypothetical protein
MQVMRQVFLFLLSGLCVNTFATIRTVSNDPSTLAQYNNVQAAVNASGSGDTIYIHGSATMYTGFTITDKRLTLIGPGWAPVKNFNGYPATIYEMTLTGAGASNSEIQGLVFHVGITINGINHPNNLRFVRNQFKGAIYFQSSSEFTGFVFEDNWFDGGLINASTVTRHSNFLFRNNIFYATGNGNVNGLYTTENIVFDHNLWYGPSTSIVNAFGYSCRNLTISNNIFVRRNAATNNTNSIFNDNITYNAGVNDPWSTTYGNTGDTSNIANQNPQLFHQDSVNAGINNPQLNFTIAGGPANNSASDGKDMGLLYDPVGLLNWTNSRISRIPYVYSMQVTNPVISPGGTLTVQVESRKSN